MPHRNVYAYRDWSTQSYHLLEGLTESYHRILPICSLRTGREQHVPDSTNQSLFHENEGNFGGNQFLYGSIRPSPPCRRRTICPSISKRAFARDSPDFVFFKHIPKVFPRVTLTQTTLKITVSGRCACVRACLWLCIVHVVVVCTLLHNVRSTSVAIVRGQKRKMPKMDNQNRLKTLSTSREKKQKTPTHCFLHFPWDLPTIFAGGSYPKRQKRPFFARGPDPKVLIMRWKRS